jgi:threonine-phosphate decarboxylase
MDPDATEPVDRVPHGSSDDSDLLDFSANTNPKMPGGVREVYREALDHSRSYPPEPPAEFSGAAANYVGCDANSVVPTPGGLAAIRLAIEVTVEPGDSVLIPAPSFGEYAREVKLQGANPAFVDQGAILESDPEGHAMAIVCTPNNPTGNAYDDETLRSFAARCRQAGTVLLVDEAFLDFIDRPSLAETEGVIVARSLTKMFGLPGIRVGFAVATGQLRMRLKAARRPWNVGTPALEVGANCLRQSSFVERTRARVRTERQRMAEQLSEAFEIHPSDAPFLLLNVGDRAVDTVLDTTQDQGIAVRDATTFRGLDSHIRVAVRLPEENDRLIEVLSDV